MKKEIADHVLERSQGLCEVCQSPYLVQLHHIVGGRGKRKQHETKESVIALCWHHHYGNKGAHGKDGKPFVTKLRLQLQEKYFSQGKTEEEVRRLMGDKLEIEQGEELKCKTKKEQTKSYEY